MERQGLGTDGNNGVNAEARPGVQGNNGENGEVRAWLE
jgi:hypothetical protein